MQARFFLRTPPGEAQKETEYVELASGFGPDVVMRAATDEDRRLHRDEYLEFSKANAPEKFAELMKSIHQEPESTVEEVTAAPEAPAHKVELSMDAVGHVTGVQVDGHEMTVSGQGE
jgi:hypothetical protein